MKPVRDEKRALGLVQRVRGFQTDKEMTIPRLPVRERLDLDQQRRHQVEGDADARELAEQRHHAPVVLDGVQTHPREDVLAGREVLVIGLMHVPEQGESSPWAIIERERMRILDRYIIREILLPFVIALVVLTFVLIIPFIIEQAEQLIQKGVAWPTILAADGDAGAGDARADDSDGAAGRRR